jgi:asparagine synthase (glutamine-hydrolysing)
MGVRDVVCYSYGIPGNWESRISQELARYLGFRWEFVPYSAERWRAWAATENFGKYFRAAGNLSSVPHIQDWPAVLELQREERIPPASVFVPGHSGDFLAGSHIPKWYVEHSIIPRRELLDSLLGVHYSLWDWPEDQQELRDEFDRRIESIVGAIHDCSPEQAADTFERWDLQERQAKFICNSVRVYESFGFDWRLPLFDCALMDFWARIPVEQRTGRRLYFEFARQRQTLPVTEANKDHGAVVNWLIRGVDSAGLRPTAKHVQRALRRLRWRREYSGSPLAWFALVDRNLFRRSYTGKELMHSYLTLQYRDLILKSVAGRSAG